MSALALPIALAALAALAVHVVSLLAHPAIARVPARLVPATLAMLLATGAALAISTVLPAHHSGCHCDWDAASVVHLCASHPERALPLLLPAAVALVVLLVRPALAVTRLARTRRATRLAMASSHGAANDDVLVLTDVPLRNAFAIAARGGRVVADRAWWDGLAEWERRAVLAHETAHLRRRDPLVSSALSLAASFVPARLGSALVERWRLRAEQCADAAAARAIGDPAAVADLLVRQHRDLDPRLAAVPALSNACSLEQRVDALLHGGAATIDDPPVSPILPLVVALGAALTAWLAAPAVHEITEALIAWMR
jgi:Zn-dependent protease with chaperone function